MASLEFPLSAETVEELKNQVQELLRTLFEDKLGGLSIGDVFTADGDVLTLTLASSSGLEKSGSALQIKIVSAGGLQAGASGLQVKIKAAGGLAADAAGLYVTTPVATQAHIPDADAAAGCIGNTTKINDIIHALESAGILATS